MRLLIDVAIVLLALVNFILIVLLLVIAWQLYRLVRYLQRELPAVANTARHTLTTVEGTADFVGTAVARPAIQAISFTVAVQRFLRVLALNRTREPERQEARR